MWHVFETFRKQKIANAAAPDRSERRRATEIGPRELSLLLAHIADRLLIFDLRRPSEIERYPFMIPDALLTTNVDLFELVRWIPPETIIVLYATEQIPRDCAVSDVGANESTIYVLKGGLKSWLEARLPTEPVLQWSGRPHSNS